jgi:hypothetical protein
MVKIGKVAELHIRANKPVILPSGLSMVQQNAEAFK